MNAAEIIPEQDWRSAIKCQSQEHGEDWSFYMGDCVELAKGIPDNKVDFAVFSPPFSNLYIYSPSDRDLGNSSDDSEFFRHYSYYVSELFRMLRPGRCVAVHCKDLVDYKGRDGRAGLRDFPGELIRVHEAAGFKYHSRITVWKCPVTEMQRTKAHGLLYKQLRTDSTFSRQGLAEYVLIFRKWADEDGSNVVPVTHTKESFTLDQWQEWASPVWMNIDQTNVLNVQLAREDSDEKHLCPLQLDLIERCVKLYSNPGEVVHSPFAGIASEGYEALKAGRKFLGFELKAAYFQRGVKNLRSARMSGSVFDLFDAAAPAALAPVEDGTEPAAAPDDSEAQARVADLEAELADYRRSYQSQAKEIARLENLAKELEEAPAKIERELDERHAEETRKLKEEISELEGTVADLEEKAENEVGEAVHSANDVAVDRVHNFLREKGLIAQGSPDDCPFEVASAGWRTDLLAAVDAGFL